MENDTRIHYLASNKKYAILLYSQVQLKNSHFTLNLLSENMDLNLESIATLRAFLGIRWKLKENFKILRSDRILQEWQNLFTKTTLVKEYSLK